MASSPNLWLILICVSLGWSLRRARVLPAATPQVLTGVVIHVAMPALAVAAMHRLVVPAGGGLELAIPVVTPWIVFALAAVGFTSLGRLVGMGRGRYGALALSCGITNTSLVGFPLLAALLGERALDIAILSDQFGTFLILSTVGTLLAAALSEGRDSDVTSSAVLRRLVTFPPLWALVVGVTTRGLSYPPVVTGVLEKLSALLVPLALLTVGWELDPRPSMVEKLARPLLLGLTVRLCILPGLVAGAFILLDWRGPVPLVTVLEMAMAPSVMASVLAGHHELDSELASTMTGVGLLVSLFTVPLWAWLLLGTFGFRWGA